MARVALPQSNLRARRRRRRVWFLLGGLVGLVAFVAALSAAAHAPALRISELAVGDSGGVSSSTVRAYIQKELTGKYFFLFPKDNIFLYPKVALQQGLRERYPTIKDAQVRAKNFHTIEVSLTLRQPVALWCLGEACRLMDEDGVVYADAPEFSNPVYTRYFGALSTTGVPPRYLSPEEFRSLFALVDALSNKVASSTAASVSVDEERDVEVKFQNSLALLFSQKDDTGDVYERFLLALESDLFVSRTLFDFEYLDLRFGEKLYYKLKTE